MVDGAETTVAGTAQTRTTGDSHEKISPPALLAEAATTKASLVKNIILFSDGTGNSSGKLFKTNVWRLYEALDLGPSSSGAHDQIAYYDSGVGTSGFKPLAILGGVFGVGLKRNVLDIYSYACRNYRPGKDQQPGADPTGQGDHVYGFGFSRGAFTMRVAIALIADQGLVPYRSERELKHKVRAAYRQFCSKNRPRYAWSPMRLVGAAGKLIGKGWRALLRIPAYDRDHNFRPVIRFMGVWDTVAAYGGPISEITRAIDNWFYPLSMPDYELNVRVQRARHALALDDERDSFHPLVWDEVHEADLIRRKAADPESLPDWIDEDRLEQVWFSGAHADVGGGYPDESLSYVSLLWMIEEAQATGIRTLDIITERYRALANSFGPIHDSRAGLAAYYRYQPRKIAAWVDPVDQSTLSLRDPAIRTNRRPKGLLREVKVHESVIARIAAGTDSYAPLVIPADFTIVPPGLEGENQPLEDSEGSETVPVEQRTPLPLADPRLRLRLQDKEVGRRRARAMEVVWDRVWLRRTAYFATLLTTAALVLMPLWIGFAPEPWFLSDGRTWIGGLIDLLRIVLPDFLDPLVRTYEHNSFYFLLVGGVIVALMRFSTWIELRLRDRTRTIWNRALVPPSQDATADKSPLARVRTSRGYQRGIQVIKWHILPNLFAALMFVALAWLLLAIYTQARLPSLERNDLCPAESGFGEIDVISRDFATRATCNAMQGRVTEGEKYVVTFDVVAPWYDSDLPASPEGLKAADLSWGTGYLGVPLRRVIGAHYLQPSFEIRPDRKASGLLHNVYIYPLQLRRDPEAPNLFHGEFVARHSGELYMFSNDDIFPFTSPKMGTADITYFYERSGSDPAWRGNRGSACVTIAHADYAEEPVPAPQTPVCQAARQAAAQRKARQEGTDRIIP